MAVPSVEFECKVTDSQQEEYIPRPAEKDVRTNELRQSNFKSNTKIGKEVRNSKYLTESSAKHLVTQLLNQKLNF